MEDKQTVIASGHPLPDAFLRRMEEMLGEDLPAFCASYGRAFSPSLRVSQLRCEQGEARDAIPFLGEEVAWQGAGFYYGGAAAAGEVRPGKHPLHEAGVYYIQEASAMLPGSLCPPAPGERVLDLCAAPGGKATQLAAALEGEGLLVANEIHRGRAAILSQNMERMGVTNAVVVSASPDELVPRFGGFFDKIVVDAPCSGEGMFRREEDAVRMWSPENVALCAERQAGILDAAAEMLAPGGHMVYSTCTFAPEENEGAVMGFLARHPDFEVVPSAEPRVVAARAAGLLDGGHPEWVKDAEAYEGAIREAVRDTYRVLPHHAAGEGHYAALLHRRGEAFDMSAGPSGPTRGGRKKGKKPLSGKENARLEETAYRLFADFAREVWGGLPTFAEGAVPCLFGERLYLVPRGLGAESAAEVRANFDGLSVLRAGVCVGNVVGLDRGRGRLEPDHALAMAASTEAAGGFDVPYDEAVAYLRGETLPAPDVRGWRVITYRGFPLGWGKASDGVMKNHYPKGLRW